MTAAETRSSLAIMGGVCRTARLPNEMLIVCVALLFTVWGVKGCRATNRLEIRCYHIENIKIF